MQQQEKNHILETLTIVGILLLIFCFWQTYQRAYQNGANDTQLATIENQIKSDVDTVELKTRLQSRLNDSINPLVLSYQKTIKNLQGDIYVLKTRKNNNNLTIASLPDSTRNKIIDSIQDYNSVSTLQHLINYSILDSMYKDCDSVSAFQSSEIKGKELQLTAYNELNTSQSTLIADLNKKVELTKPPKKHPLLKTLKTIGQSIVGILATIGGYSLYQAVK